MRSGLRVEGAGAACAVVIALGAGMPGAAAQGVEVGGGGSQYFLGNSLTAHVDTTFTYGRVADRAYFGNGNNTDTPAVRRGATYYFRYVIAGGTADLTIMYGRPDDVTLVGDWDGDAEGVDTLAVRRGVTNFVKNSLAGGEADLTFDFGLPTDTAFAGDWNSDGADTLGLRRPPVVNCAVVACVALTFDDGPSPHTERLIDTLTRLNVPATSFVVGGQVGNRPATVRRQKAEGFAVENHTYSHPQLSLLSYRAQLSEVQRADNALVAAGVPPSTRDWDGRTATQIRSRVVTYTRSGSIVPMHDSVSATMDAVPGIVAALRAKGYVLVTVETLVPWMEPGDVVYSRGQVVDATTAFDPSLGTLRAPDGSTLGPVVDDAAFQPSN
ncbi:MAG: polysaccharide deacetylase family protein [Dermatophilaceae bacterium]|nr:polysaccharide deacetylase family protein [Intrasporangiaceae bacterium]